MLSGLRYLLVRVTEVEVETEVEAMEQALGTGTCHEEAYAMGGKYLRGSKRAGTEALQVATLAEVAFD